MLYPATAFNFLVGDRTLAQQHSLYQKPGFLKKPGFLTPELVEKSYIEKIVTKLNISQWPNNWPSDPEKLDYNNVKQASCPFDNYLLPITKKYVYTPRIRSKINRNLPRENGLLHPRKSPLANRNIRN